MKNEILSKIKKLMALSKSPNINEASLALSKARELMNKHGVTSSELISSDIAETESKPMPTRTIPLYISLLAGTVAELFGCEMYWTTEGYWNKSWTRRIWKSTPVFVGFSPSQDLCAYCYDNLVRQLLKQRTDFESKYLSRKLVTLEKDSFALGWVEGVRKNIIHLIPEKPSVEIPEGNGLIKVNPLEKYVNDECSGTMKSRSGDVDQRALQEGYENGQSTLVHKAMSKEDLLQIQ